MVEGEDERFLERYNISSLPRAPATIKRKDSQGTKGKKKKEGKVLLGHSKNKPKNTTYSK